MEDIILDIYNNLDDFIFPHFLEFNKSICWYFLDNLSETTRILEKIAEEHSEYYRVYLFIGIIYKSY